MKSFIHAPLCVAKADRRRLARSAMGDQADVLAKLSATDRPAGVTRAPAFSRYVRLVR
jgi:hypothetical protein